MKIVCALLIFLPLQASPNSLCGKGEKVYFSCDTGKEVISVCGSEKIAQYRSGSIKNIEFVFPTNGLKSEEKLFYSEGRASKYLEKHLRFDDGAKMVVVFDRWNSDVSGASTTTRGVAIFAHGAMPTDGDKPVFKDEQLIEKKMCKRSTGIHMEQSWRANLEGEDFTYGP